MKTSDMDPRDGVCLLIVRRKEAAAQTWDGSLSVDGKLVASVSGAESFAAAFRELDREVADSDFA
jgi:hypothetical protein